MEPRTYKIGKKNVEIKNQHILELLESAENLEISPREAESKIRNYLFSNRNLGITETFEKLNLLEKMTEGFFAPGGGRATPLVERYAEMHKLSARIDTDPEDIYDCPKIDDNSEDIYDWNKIDRFNALKRMGIRLECSDSDFYDMGKLNALVARQREKEIIKGTYRT